MTVSFRSQRSTRRAEETTTTRKALQPCTKHTWLNRWNRTGTQAGLGDQPVADARPRPFYPFTGKHTRPINLYHKTSYRHHYSRHSTWIGRALSPHNPAACYYPAYHQRFQQSLQHPLKYIPTIVANRHSQPHPVYDYGARQHARSLFF